MFSGVLIVIPTLDLQKRSNTHLTLAKAVTFSKFAFPTTALGLSALAIHESADWRIVWCAIVAAIPILALPLQVLSAIRKSRVRLDSIANSAKDAANDINRYLWMGIRPRLWEIDCIRALETEEIASSAEASYFSYWMFLDQGLIEDAGRAIEAAAYTSLEAIRAKPLLSDWMVRSFVEMAFFCARYRDDAASGRTWLALCGQCWIEPTSRLRAESAIHLASDDRPRAILCADAARKKLVQEADLGTAQYEIALIDELLGECTNAYRATYVAPDQSVRAPSAPTIANGRGGEIGARAFPFLAYLVLVFGMELVAPDSFQGGRQIVVALGIVLAGSVLGMLAMGMYATFAMSWIEIWNDGIRYVAGGSSYWIGWAQICVPADTAPRDLKKNRLSLTDPIPYRRTRGPQKAFRSIPMELYSPRWKQNEIGARIRKFAPGLIETN